MTIDQMGFIILVFGIFGTVLLAIIFFLLLVIVESYAALKKRVKRLEQNEVEYEALADFDYSDISADNPCASCVLNDVPVCGSSIELCRQ